MALRIPLLAPAVFGTSVKHYRAQNMNCGTCKFWFDEKFRLLKNGNQSNDDTRNENGGTCRRYAPSARQNNFRSWPVTVASDFCHDYLPAPPPEPGPVEVAPKSDPLTPIRSVFGRRKKGA